MTSHRLVTRCGLLAVLFVANAAVAAAQERELDPLRFDLTVERLEQGSTTFIMRPGPPLNTAGSDPLAGPVVKYAPYSGDAVTAVTQTLGDGTRIEQSTTAKFYRDSAGRVRREQTIIGLGPLNTPFVTTRRSDSSNDAKTLITIDPDPDDGFAFQLDTTTRTARRVPRMAATPGMNVAVATFTLNWSLPRPLNSQDDRTVDQSLGTRQMEGVKATGRKTTLTIPAGEIGNDRPIEVTDERWESPELQVVIYSRHSDPRTGIVEYRLTNINRLEPPLDLFTVPPDYTIIEGGGRVGQRTGGAGGRGAPQPGARGRQ